MLKSFLRLKYAGETLTWSNSIITITTAVNNVPKAALLFIYSDLKSL